MVFLVIILLNVTAYQLCCDVDPLVASEPLPKRLDAHTAITTHAL